LVALAVLVWRGLEELRLKDVSESFGLAGHEQKATQSVPRRFELFGSLPAMVRVLKMRHRGFFFFLGPLAFCSGPIM